MGKMAVVEARREGTVHKVTSDNKIAEYWIIQDLGDRKTQTDNEDGATFCSV